MFVGQGTWFGVMPEGKGRDIEISESPAFSLGLGHKKTGKLLFKRSADPYLLSLSAYFCPFLSPAVSFPLLLLLSAFETGTMGLGRIG